MTIESPRFPTLDEFATEEWAQRAFLEDERIVVHLAELNARENAKIPLEDRKGEDAFMPVILDPGIKRGLEKALDMLLADPKPYTRIFKLYLRLYHKQEDWDSENVKSITPEIKRSHFKDKADEQSLFKSVLEVFEASVERNEIMLPVVSLSAISDYIQEMIYTRNINYFDSIEIDDALDAAGIMTCNTVVATVDELIESGMKRDEAEKFWRRRFFFYNRTIAEFIFEKELMENAPAEPSQDKPDLTPPS